MSKKKLFDDDSEEDIAIITENAYAKKYDTWREKEELHKLEQKYGPDAHKADGSVSSDSEDDSDEPPEVSEEVEEQFLKTLALLKTKDPRIYDPSFKCFEEEQKKAEEKSKPKTLTFDDSDDEDDGGDIFKIEKKAEIDDDNTRKATSNEAPKKKKEKKIKEYLTGKAEHVDEEVERDLAPLKALWSDPKLNEGEAFLRDYILNKRYLDGGEDGDADAAERLRDDADLEADEQTVEEQAKFERAYNFRFEEPDDEYLKRYPRTMSTIRPKDERRARKRAEVRTRKEEAKRRKMEEIARLKALKLKEIQEKIAKIKEVTGNAELAFKEDDIEGEFDPEEHDRRMKALFDEQFYGEADDQKPIFPDLDEELEIENWDNYDVDAPPAERPGDDEPHCEDEDFNMDADFDPQKPRANLLEEIQKTLGSKRRRRKRATKLGALLAARPPRFLPGAGDYARHMQQYYAMDCEDVLGGDLPTRFKYREVVPNDYGLTVEEILLADDRELTQWVPLKKMMKHRPEGVERGEVKTYAQRAADARLKRRLLPSLFRDLPEEPELVMPVEEEKKKKKKKRKNKEKSAEEADAAEDLDESVQQNVENEGQPDENRKKKKNKQHNTRDADDTEKQDNKMPEQVKETEVQPEVKQKKKKKKKPNSESNYDEEVVNSVHEVISHESNLNSSVDGSKKKNKSKNMDTETISKESSQNVAATSTKITPSEVKSNKNKKKKLKPLVNGGDNVNSNVSEHIVTNVGGKKNKQRSDSFVVEDVSTQGPSQDSNIIANSRPKSNKNDCNTGKGVKRKSDTQMDNNQHKKRKNDNSKGKKDFKSKFNQKDKFKNKKVFNNKQKPDASNDNPLSKLSDERLKAYGLNPKKYKNFLKYKKF